jgi:hypothetical protein
VHRKEQGRHGKHAGQRFEVDRMEHIDREDQRRDGEETTERRQGPLPRASWTPVARGGQL